ncbi:MAG: hypothetical protein ACTHZ1_03765 [Sphingobacterium sp.]
MAIKLSSSTPEHTNPMQSAESGVGFLITVLHLVLANCLVTVLVIVFDSKERHAVAEWRVNNPDSVGRLSVYV